MGIFIDRSDNNPPDDYERAGLRHIYIKLSEGLTDNQSAAFSTRAAEARRAGANVGAYHFSQLNNPISECDFFVSKLRELANPKAGDLRPAFDIERGQSIAWVEDFAVRFRNLVGYWPTLYGNTSTIGPMRSRSELVRALPWWRAEYGPDDGQPHPLVDGSQGAAIHQYTQNAHFTGITGGTDADMLLRGDIALVPRREKERSALPAVAWRWARWRLGLAEYAGHAGDMRMRPAQAPRLIPLRWWGAVRWYKRHVL